MVFLWQVMTNFLSSFLCSALQTKKRRASLPIKRRSTTWPRSRRSPVPILRRSFPARRPKVSIFSTSYSSSTRTSDWLLKTRSTTHFSTESETRQEKNSAATKSIWTLSKTLTSTSIKCESCFCRRLPTSEKLIRWWGSEIDEGKLNLS